MNAKFHSAFHSARQGRVKDTHECWRCTFSGRATRKNLSMGRAPLAARPIPAPPRPYLGPPPAGRSDGLGDDPDELLGDGEVEAEAVLEHRRGGPGGGVGVGPGPTDAPHPERGGCGLGVAPELADGEAQPPGDLVPED